jgi:signal transduction histidine kinase
MNDKPTYQVLENQVAELHTQNEILRSDFSFQSLEREKRAAELKIANIELKHQKGEKKKRAAALKIANIELDYQNGEKEKRAAELKIANIELIHQSREKGRRAGELKIANTELIYQSGEKKKRAAELIIANIELVFQKEEKAKRAAELVISKIKFAQQSDENEKLADELIIANLAVALQSDLIVAKEKAEENEIQLIALNATKDRLFSIIAHDLRSPFHSILGISDLLIKNIENSEAENTAELLGFISLSAKKTLILLDNLLDWAKSQTGQINFESERFILSSTIQEILDISLASAKLKNISLNYMPSYDMEVFTNENMLKIVLRNLISNAIKFTKSGGNINVLAISKQNQVEISISDNGVGMNKETCTKLFNISISENTSSIGTANEKGSGLGLILCKEFVEKLDGKIWVESELGKGSSFKFTLPLN